MTSDKVRVLEGADLEDVEVMCDGNGECFRLEKENATLRAEIAKHDGCNAYDCGDCIGEIRAALAAHGGSMTPAKLQLFDSDGMPAKGGHLYIYHAGTYEPGEVFSDPMRQWRHKNPVVLDGEGRSNVYRVPGKSYDFALSVWDKKQQKFVRLWAKANITTPEG